MTETNFRKALGFVLFAVIVILFYSRYSVWAWIGVAIIVVRGFNLRPVIALPGRPPKRHARQRFDSTLRDQGANNNGEEGIFEQPSVDRRSTINLDGNPGALHKRRTIFLDSITEAPYDPLDEKHDDLADAEVRSLRQSLRSIKKELIKLRNAKS